MAPLSPTERLTRLSEICRERGLTLTVQRRAILETLVGRTDHPSAEQVFESVTSRLPGVSRATIYRALETLAEMGLVRAVAHAGEVGRYDVRTDDHHHLVCDHCGAIADWEAAVSPSFPVPARELTGWDLRSVSVNFHGRCGSCATASGAADRAAGGSGTPTARATPN